MIKAIIFDIGGVLIRTEDKAPRAALEVRLGLPPGAAEQIVLNSEMGRKAQLGQHSATEQWAWVQQHLGLSAAELEIFRTEFWAGDRIDPIRVHRGDICGRACGGIVAVAGIAALQRQRLARRDRRHRFQSIVPSAMAMAGMDRPPGRSCVTAHRARRGRSRMAALSSMYFSASIM